MGYGRPRAPRAAWLACGTVLASLLGILATSSKSLPLATGVGISRRPLMRPPATLAGGSRRGYSFRSRCVSEPVAEKTVEEVVPVKGEGKEFDPGDPWTIPESFPKTQRTFQCFDKGEEYSGDKLAICADGLVPGASLHLSHWSNNLTPRQLYSDLSTEIALRFIKTKASRAEEWDSSVVCNNHFDTDGVCSAYILLNPAKGWEHRRILVDAAAVGDFDEWPRMDENGLKLHGAIMALADTVSGAKEKYNLVLSKMTDLIENIDSHRDLWGPFMTVVEEGIDNFDTYVNASPDQVYVDNSIAVIRLPFGVKPPVGSVRHKKFGFAVDRYLVGEEKEEGSEIYKWTYEMIGHAWAPVIQRPKMKKPFLEKMIKTMTEFTGTEWIADESGLTTLMTSKDYIDMDFEDVVLKLVECDNTLRTLEVLERTTENRDVRDDLLSGDALKRDKSKVRY